MVDGAVSVSVLFGCIDLLVSHFPEFGLSNLSIDLCRVPDQISLNPRVIEPENERDVRMWWSSCGKNWNITLLLQSVEETTSPGGDKDLDNLYTIGLGVKTSGVCFAELFEEGSWHW